MKDTSVNLPNLNSGLCGRCDRAVAQLSKLRAEAGQAGPPDMDEEEKLRSSVKSLEGERDRLAQAHEQLAQSILEVAVQMPASANTPSTTPGELRFPETCWLSCPFILNLAASS